MNALFLSPRTFMSWCTSSSSTSFLLPIYPLPSSFPLPYVWLSRLIFSFVYVSHVPSGPFSSPHVTSRHVSLVLCSYHGCNFNLRPTRPARTLLGKLMRSVGTTATTCGSFWRKTGQTKWTRRPQRSCA